MKRLPPHMPADSLSDVPLAVYGRCAGQTRAAHSVLRILIGAWLVFVVLGGCTDSDPAYGPDGRKKIHVYLLLISTKQVDYYQWAERTYEARNPGVDVVIEQFPGSSLKDYEVKLRLRYSSGQAPDAFILRTGLLSELVSYGLVEPAPAFIDSLRRVEGRTRAIREAPVIEGRSYGMTAAASPMVLYYNRDMFQAEGLDPDRPPRTWNELVRHAERLARYDASGTLTRAGFSLRKRGYQPGTAGKWLTFLYSAGGRAFDADARTSRFRSPAGREALRLYEEILFQKNLDDIDLQGDQQGFGQKKTAMLLREVHVIRWLEENYPDLNFGVAPVPRRDTSLSYINPYIWTVSSQTPHPTASWRFIEFLMSEEAYARYASIGGVVPVTQSVAAREPFAEDPYLQVFLNQRMKAPDVFPRENRAKAILGAHIERFCYGRMGVDKTLRRAEENVNALLGQPPRGRALPAAASQVKREVPTRRIHHRSKKAAPHPPERPGSREPE
jgi:multiple sugar transport system substrate-binding protein